MKQTDRNIIFPQISVSVQKIFIVISCKHDHSLSFPVVSKIDIIYTFKMNIVALLGVDRSFNTAERAKKPITLLIHRLEHSNIHNQSIYKSLSVDHFPQFLISIRTKIYFTRGVSSAKREDVSQCKNLMSYFLAEC